MKKYLFCNGSANQKALANKLHNAVGLDGIIIEKKAVKRTWSWNKVIAKLFYSKIDHAWHTMLEHFANQYEAWPATELYHTQSINSLFVENILKQQTDFLIFVSGTGLIRQNIIDICPSRSIINLHTGLSPYMNGGPNCTNWCIANGTYHMIGNTILWLDKGIDSGNLIHTECTTFLGNESLSEVHIKVMTHAHQMYVNVARLAVGNKSQLKNVPQNDIGKSTTYYSRMWTNSKRSLLMKNFSHFAQNIHSKNYKALQEKLKTVQL